MSERLHFQTPDSIGPIVDLRSDIGDSPCPMNSKLRNTILFTASSAPLLVGVLGAIAPGGGELVFGLSLFVQVLCWLAALVFYVWSYHRRHELHIGRDGFALFLVYGTSKKPSVTTIHWAAVEQVQTKRVVMHSRHGTGNLFQQTWIGTDGRVLAKFKLNWPSGAAIIEFDEHAAILYRSLQRAENAYSQHVVSGLVRVMNDNGQLTLPASRSGKHTMVISHGRLVLMKRSKVVCDLPSEAVAELVVSDGGLEAIEISRGSRRRQSIIRADCPNKTVVLAILGKYFHPDFHEYCPEIDEQKGRATVPDGSVECLS